MEKKILINICFLHLFYWHHTEVTQPWLKPDIFPTLHKSFKWLNYCSSTTWYTSHTIRKKVTKILGFLQVKFIIVYQFKTSYSSQNMLLKAHQIPVTLISTIKYPSLDLLCIYLLVSYVTRMMYPNKFVECLASTGAQLKSYMKTMLCLLYWNTTEISVFVVVNRFLCKEKEICDAERTQSATIYHWD